MSGSFIVIVGYCNYMQAHYAHINRDINLHECKLCIITLVKQTKNKEKKTMNVQCRKKLSDN